MQLCLYSFNTNLHETETIEDYKWQSYALFSPSEREVVPMVLQGFAVLLQVEVSVAQLAVNGTEGLEIICSHLNSSFKEYCTIFKISCFTQSFPLQRQLQNKMPPSCKHKAFRFYNE